MPTIPGFDHAMTDLRVAVLHQGAPPPSLGGARKPAKPGGYADSSADIVCALLRRGASIVTPVEHPDPSCDLDWSFPDTAAGIGDALQRGASVLWANTTLHAAHAITSFASTAARVVGHLPLDAERADDKAWVKSRLAARGIAVPAGILVSAPSVGTGDHTPATTLRCLTLSEVTNEALANAGLHFPLIVKPVRGRGSVGVQRVDDLGELHECAGRLLGLRGDRGTEQDHPTVGRVVLVESYCEGVELTVTVSPTRSAGDIDSASSDDAYAVLPPVERIGHIRGVVPSLDAIPVRFTGRPFEPDSVGPDDLRHLQRATREAAAVARLLHARSIIRIDFRQDDSGIWRILDVNFKPSLTGPGRPGRESEVSLVGLAAGRAGVSYDDLICRLLRSAWPLGDIATR